MKREEILGAFKEGRINLKETLDQIDQSYYKNIGHTTLDLDRETRTGAPEVVFGLGKTAQQIIEIIDLLVSKEINVLVTKIDEQKYANLSSSLPKQAVYSPNSEILSIKMREVKLTKSFV